MNGKSIQKEWQNLASTCLQHLQEAVWSVTKEVIFARDVSWSNHQDIYIRLCAAHDCPSRVQVHCRALALQVLASLAGRQEGMPGPPAGRLLHSIVVQESELWVTVPVEPSTVQTLHSELGCRSYLLTAP